MDRGSGTGLGGIPALLRAYLDIGAKVLGLPTMDREFRTIDWLVTPCIERLPCFTSRTVFR